MQRRNRVAATCASCGQRVAPRRGVIETRGGVPRVVHENCQKNLEPAAPPVVAPGKPLRRIRRSDPVMFPAIAGAGRSIASHRRAAFAVTAAGLLAGFAAVLATDTTDTSRVSVGRDLAVVTSIDPAPPTTQGSETEVLSTVESAAPATEVAAEEVASTAAGPRPTRVSAAASSVADSTLMPPGTTDSTVITAAPTNPPSVTSAPATTAAPTTTAAPNPRRAPTTTSPTTKSPTTTKAPTTTRSGDRTTTTRDPTDRKGKTHG
jgi:hypothetical protein